MSVSANSVGFSIFNLISFIIRIVIIIFLIILAKKKLVPWIKKNKEKRKSGEKKKLNPLFKILCALGFVIDFLIIGFISQWDFGPEDIILLLIVLIIPGILTQCLYFLPYIIANNKCHQQETAIFVLNLFAGWTVVAWIICIVWAFTKPKQDKIVAAAPSNAKQIEEYKDLLDKGIITQDEFNEKKQQLLR